MRDQAPPPCTVDQLDPERRSEVLSLLELLRHLGGPWTFHCTTYQAEVVADMERCGFCRTTVDDEFPNARRLDLIDPAPPAEEGR